MWIKYCTENNFLSTLTENSEQLKIKTHFVIPGIVVCLVNCSGNTKHMVALHTSYIIICGGKQFKIFEKNRWDRLRFGRPNNTDVFPFPHKTITRRTEKITEMYCAYAVFLTTKNHVLFRVVTLLSRLVTRKPGQNTKCTKRLALRSFSTILKRRHRRARATRARLL